MTSMRSERTSTAFWLVLVPRRPTLSPWSTLPTSSSSLYATCSVLSDPLPIRCLTGRHHLSSRRRRILDRLQLRPSHQHMSYTVRPTLHVGIPRFDSFYSLGYIPGHIHAFWLIYKKMQAEERYGSGGFRCASFPSSSSSSAFQLILVYRCW